jgi:hypothetical protein
MDYQIAIPSYRRAGTLRNKTLALLARAGADPKRVTIFVATGAERERYEEGVPREMYGQIVVGEPTLRAQRTVIQKHYPDGARVLQMDDDMEALFVRKDEKHYHGEVSNFDELVRQGFEACEKAGSKIWSVYPVANPYFMRQTVTTQLCLMVGCFFGVLNSPGEEFTITTPEGEKEDYERTIKCYQKAGVVCRLDYVCTKTGFYTEPGGMQASPGRLARQEAAVEQLVKKYPQFLTRNSGSKSKFPEMRISDDRKPKIDVPDEELLRLVAGGSVPEVH